MKKKMSELAETGKENLQAIADAIAEDKVHEALEKFNDEREKIMSDLADRIGKVCELKLQLEATQEDNARLEMLMSGDFETQAFIKQLQKQIESITLMYHEVASDASANKVELQVIKKKLKSKETKIDKLEK
jgi:phage-related protein